MTATLSEVRTALYEALQPLVPTWNVMERLTGNPGTPALAIVRGPALAHTAFSKRSPQYDFVVLALVKTTDLEAAQEYIDDLLSRGNTNSLWDRLEADPTLGGVVATVIPGQPEGDDYIDLGGVLYFGTRIPITVTP